MSGRPESSPSASSSPATAEAAAAVGARGPEGVGGWATREPVVASDAEPGPVSGGGSGAGRGGRLLPQSEVEAWGRAQAGRAPRWSADKRRRVAALLGLVLPEHDTGAG